MLGARDLRAFCRQPVGVPVEFAGVSTYADDNTPICGLYDQQGDIFGGEQGTAAVVGAKPMLQLPCNAFNPMPRRGSIITVTPVDEPIDYETSAPSPIDDGGFVTYELSLPGEEIE